MDVRLVVHHGKSAPQEIALRRFPALVGRHKDCTLRITSRLVSREHCIFHDRNGWLTIIDLNSANGTVVNGSSITSETILRPQDQVEIGSIRFQVDYTLPDSPQPAFGESEDATVMDSAFEAIQRNNPDSPEMAEQLRQVIGRSTSDTIADAPTQEYRAGDEGDREDSVDSALSELAEGGDSTTL